MRDEKVGLTVQRGDAAVLLGHVRPEVARFALLMERELQRNDWKGGWGQTPMSRLRTRLEGEVREVRRELTRSLLRPEKVGEEAADVGNYAMMIADRAGALK